MLRGVADEAWFDNVCEHFKLEQNADADGHDLAARLRGRMGPSDHLGPMPNDQPLHLDLSNLKLKIPDRIRTVVTLVTAPISGLPPVVGLTLANNLLTSDDVEIIVAAPWLFCEGGLEKLDLGDNATIELENHLATAGALCGALSHSRFASLCLNDIGMGPLSLNTLSKAISDMVGLSEVNLSANKCFDAQSAKVFSDAVLKSNVNTLVIGNDIEIPIKGTVATSLDFSNQDFGPGELVLISSLVIPFSALLSEVNLSTNKCFGSKDKRYDDKTQDDDKTQVHDVDKDQTGFGAICDALSGCSKLNSINFSDIGMGPKGAMLTSSMLRSERLNAAISLFDISGNFIFGITPWGHNVDKDQTGFAAICDALSGCSGLHSINFSDIGMGPKGAVMMSSMLRSERLTAAISSFDISDNKGILGELYSDGSLKEPDAHLAEFKQLLDAIGELQNLSSLNLAGIGIGPQGAVMTSAMLTSQKVIAAISRLLIGANPIGTEGAQALIDVLPQTQIQVLGIGKD
eukprot:SAG11_NODE_1472_length_4841_cov_2.468157_5_plen_516_part_01